MAAPPPPPGERKSSSRECFFATFDILAALPNLKVELLVVRFFFYFLDSLFRLTLEVEVVLDGAS